MATSVRGSTLFDLPQQLHSGLRGKLEIGQPPNPVFSASSRARAASRAFSASAHAKFRELPMVMHRRRMLCSSSTHQQNVFSVRRSWFPEGFLHKRSLIVVREMVFFNAWRAALCQKKLGSHCLRCPPLISMMRRATVQVDFFLNPGVHFRPRLRRRACEYRKSRPRVFACGQHLQAFGARCGVRYRIFRGASSAARKESGHRRLILDEQKWALLAGDVCAFIARPLFASAAVYAGFIGDGNAHDKRAAAVLRIIPA